MNDNRNFGRDRADKSADAVRSAADEREMAFQLFQLPHAREDPASQTADLAARLRFIELARGELTNRRRRIGIFGATMFGEPGWEVLLTLYASDSRHLTIARISKTVTASWSSTLRWIEQLDETGMVTREPNPTDRRSVLVAITPKGVRALDLYFSQMPKSEE
jgi:DNA-binding MarR family transcriptional regulator